MRLLSFDVGIKNLAYCLIETNDKHYTYSIKKWDVIDLCNESSQSCSHCKKKAFFKKNSVNYCKVHAKKSDYKIPGPDETIKKIGKKKIKEVIAIATSFKIQDIDIINKTKETILELIDNHIKKEYLDKIVDEKTGDYNLICLGINLKKCLDLEFDLNFKDVDIIIIENQISTLASRMKSLQAMIAQYFIMRDKDKIEFISASNKLKQFTESSEKTTYNQRKKLAIEIARGILTKNQNLLLDFFNKHKKKDDLADCFLQGLYYLKKV